MIDVWAPTNLAMGNLSNALSGYRARQIAKAQSAEETEQQQFSNALAYRNAQMQQEAHEQRMKINDLGMRTQQAEHEQRMQRGGIDIQQKQRQQMVYNAKMAYHALEPVKDQESLDQLRRFTSNMLGNNPEVLDEIPTVYNDEAAAKIDGFRNMWGSVLRDQLNQKEHWVEGPDGRKNIAWFEQGSDPQLPDGYKFTTPPNDNLELAKIDQDTTLKKQEMVNAAAERKAMLAQKAQNIRKKMELNAGKTDRTVQDERNMRKDFLALPAVKTYNRIEPMFDRMDAAMDDIESQNSLPVSERSYASADEVMIMALKKMLDEGVVMPAEFARTAESLSIPSQIFAKISKWKQGGELNENERSAMIRLGRHLKNLAVEDYKAEQDHWDWLSEQYGLDPMKTSRHTPKEQEAAYQKKEASQSNESLVDELFKSEGW